MLCKILVALLLSMPLALGGTTISIQEVSTGSNNTIIKSSAISNEIVVGETSADLLASDDKTLTDVNIVNYNVSTGATTFEYFDKYSYEARNGNSVNSIDDSSLNTSPGSTVVEVNVPDFDIHQLGDTDMYYVNGYTPLNTIFSGETDGEEAISPDAVIGTDERTQVTNTKSDPYLKIAYIRMTYDDVYNKYTKKYEDVTYIGTAFMVGPNMAATAGHCVYKDVTGTGNYDDGIDNPRFPDKVEFYFGVSSNSEATGSYKYYAEAEVLHIEYSYYVSPNFDHDWAVIEFDRNLRNSIGWLGMVVNWYDTSAPVSTIGYPEDKPRATMWETTGSFFAMTDYCYLTDDIDMMSGQSGSPYLVTAFEIDNLVCGIHTFGSVSQSFEYNGGTILNPFIFNYIHSFTSGFSQERHYEHPFLSIFTKTGSTWIIEVENTSSAGINLEYNSKMCFFNDAKNWTGLNDEKEIYIGPYESNFIAISENVFATSITCSYVRGGERIITYANNLDTDGTLSTYFNVISA